MSLLACALAALAVLVVGRPASGHRLARLPPPTGTGTTEGNPGRRPPPVDRLLQGRGRRASAAAAGIVAAFLWGGWAGWVLGLLLAIGLDRALARMEPRSVRVRRSRLGRDLPLAADLLGACLRAGRPPSTAVESVARALAGPLGSELTVVAAALRLGAEPRVAWGPFLDEPVLAAFGAALARAWDSGAPLADSLDRIARDVRGRRRSAAEQRARAVGVKAAAPLGLCFLPAFLLIGVVPVVIGAVSALLP